MLVGLHQIPGTQPTVGREPVGAHFGLLVVADGVRPAAAPQFAHFPRHAIPRHIQEIHDPDFTAGHGQASAAELLDPPARRQDVGTAFGQSVSLANVAVELLFDRVHQFPWHGRGTAHQQFNGGHIQAGQGFALRQQQTIHRGCAAHKGRPVAVNRFQDGHRVKTGQDRHRAANVQHGQHRAPEGIGVVQRPRNQGFVVFVVHHRLRARFRGPPFTRMGQHTTLRAARRTGRVHDHRDVIALDLDGLESRRCFCQQPIIGGDALYFAITIAACY